MSVVIMTHYGCTDVAAAYEVIEEVKNVSQLITSRGMSDPLRDHSVSPGNEDH